MKTAVAAKWFFCVLLLTVSLFSCGQSNAVVKKVYSFYTERLPGNIAVDKSGNEIMPAADTSIQVYVETTAKNIIWDTAWFNNKTYIIITQAVIKDSIDAGIKKDAMVRAVIRAKKGSYIWQLYLERLPANKINAKYKKMAGDNEILLKGKYKGMIFLQKAGKPVQLEIIPSV